MGLETAQTIGGLNPAWPLGVDPVSQGDDHVRLIKAVLQAIVSKEIAEDATDQTPQVWSAERIHQAIAAWQQETSQPYTTQLSKAAQQAITLNTLTQVTMDTIEWNQFDWWSPSEYNPQEAGVYAVSWAFDWIGQGDQMRIELHKNDVVYRVHEKTIAPQAVTTLVLMNGDTDQLKVFVSHSNTDGGGVRQLGGDPTSNWLSFQKVSDYQIPPPV